MSRHEHCRPALQRVAAADSFEARAILRNGEQLLVTIVVPVLVLVGLTKATVDRPRHRRRQPDRLPHAGHPGPGRDDHVVHVAGDRLVVRPAQRRAPAAVDDAARARRAARRQGARRARRGGGADRRHRPRPRSCSAGSPDPAGIPLALVAVVLGTAAFTSLALLVAGTLRAEAVLAVANLLLLVLARGRRRRHPGEPAAGADVARRTAAAVGCARRGHARVAAARHAAGVVRRDPRRLDGRARLGRGRGCSAGTEAPLRVTRLAGPSGRGADAPDLRLVT